MKDFLIPFAIVCACGLFVCLAAGIEWGTLNCGRVSALTLFAACLSGFLVFLLRCDK